MSDEKETEKKIQQLQMLEQNLQAILMQKQQFQTQLAELESALKELGKTKEVYKIIGNVMVSSQKEDIDKEFKQKKEILDMRIKSFEKQEETFRKKAKDIQEDVLSNMKE